MIGSKSDRKCAARINVDRFGMRGECDGVGRMVEDWVEVKELLGDGRGRAGEICRAQV